MSIGKAGICYNRFRFGRFLFLFCDKTSDKPLSTLTYYVHDNNYIMIGWK